MMSQVVSAEGGTGARARIDGWEIAGKTGTTSAARDAWFIGFTGEFVTGVWMGYDDNRPLKGVTGGGLPADIWRETMTRVLAGRTLVPLPMDAPSGMVSAAPIMEGGTGPVAPDSQINDLLLNILGGN